jgi:predicted Na+-dependent transporter
LVALNLIAPIAVALVVFAQALTVSARDVAAYFRDHPWLIARSLAATLVLAPAAALCVILLMKPAPGVAVGLAILLSSPPAPLMIKATPNLGHGRAAFIACLHVTLAALAFFTVPVVLEAMSAPLGFEADVDLAKMAVILGRTILGPVLLGLVVRAVSVKFADAAGPKLDKVGGIGILAALLCLLIASGRWLADMDPWSYLVITVVAVVSLAIGHFAGTRDPHERTALAVESGIRHPALAITIGATNFTPQKALPVLVPCVLAFTVVGAVYLVLRRKSVGAKSAASAGDG